MSDAPDYRERARVDLDEALFRNANQAEPLDVLVPAVLSIAGSLIALADAARQGTGTLEHLAEEVRPLLPAFERLAYPERTVTVPVGVPCSCGMARLDNGRKRLEGGVLHRADGPCYRSTSLEDVPAQRTRGVAPCRCGAWAELALDAWADVDGVRHTREGCAPA